MGSPIGSPMNLHLPSTRSQYFLIPEGSATIQRVGGIHLVTAEEIFRKQTIKSDHYIVPIHCKNCMYTSNFTFKKPDQ